MVIGITKDTTASAASFKLLGGPAHRIEAHLDPLRRHAVARCRFAARRSAAGAAQRVADGKAYLQLFAARFACILATQALMSSPSTNSSGFG